MRRLGLQLGLFAFAAAATFVSGQAFAADPLPALRVEAYRLGNGMRLFLAPDPTLDDVSVVTRYDVGSADDPQDKEGLAHLVEHLMYDGSKHVGPGDYARWIARAGGYNMNGATSPDSTTYYVTVPPDSLPLVFWLESDRMGFLRDGLNLRNLNLERGLIADEARDLEFDRNLGFVDRIGWKQLFPEWHPYHRNGYPAKPTSLTLEDVRAFLRTWYSPTNATLAVAGHFDVGEVRSLAEKYFGGLRGADPPERPALPSHWVVGQPRFDVGAAVPHDVVTAIWTTPALGDPGDAELDLAAAILSDPQGRLQHELVTPGIAVSVSSRQASWRRGSAFHVSVVLADGASIGTAIATLDRTLADLSANLQADECNRARDEWADSTLLRFETSISRASHLSFRGDREPLWLRGKYDTLGPEGVGRAVRTYLGTSDHVVVVVHHDKRYPAQGMVLREGERSP